jgi:hypothetical protein
MAPSILWAFLALLPYTTLPVTALNAVNCATTSSKTGFPIVNNGKASPILIASDEWPGVQIATTNFATDLQMITGAKPSVTNFTSGSSSRNTGSVPIIIGTLGHSSLIDAVLNNTKMDVSAINGSWESFHASVVENPLPGVSRAYVMIGADKRGSIFNIYTHSESFGVSPWYW